jgi:SAM-dependent methyltransferase
MDAERLALRAASVDVVLMAFMLFHLDRPIEGLREARRVLRAAGRLGSLTWAGELESTATRVWTECLDAHGAVPADPSLATRHEPVDRPDKVEALLVQAGFASVRSWEDQLVCTLDAEHLVRLKTSMGSSKPRFDSLSAAAREACVTEARLRMQALAPADFVARGAVVCAVASV